jgi:hypothetical protein
MTPWIVVVAQVVSLTLGDRTETRARTLSNTTYFDVETRPLAQLDVKGRRARWSLTYVPTISTLSLGTSLEQTLFLQLGRSELSYRWRRTTLRWIEDASYGRQSFQVYALSQAPVTTGGAGAPPGGTAPPGGIGSTSQLGYLHQTLLTGSLDSTAEIDHAFTRRVQGQLSGGYRLFGGLDNTSREALPWMRGPHGSARLSVRASRVDTLSTSVNGYSLVASNGRTPWLTWAEEEWEHRWSRQWSGRWTAGAASANGYPMLGVASTSIRWRTLLGRESAFLADGAVRLAPMIDARTALVDERVSAELGGAWSRGDWTLLTRGTWVRSTDTKKATGVEILLGSAGISWQVARWVALETGVRATQYTVGGTTTLPAEWAVFGALRLAETWPQAAKGPSAAGAQAR